jgi:hypothetical protein
MRLVRSNSPFGNRRCCAEAGALLVACRLAGLSALVFDYAVGAAGAQLAGSGGIRGVCCAIRARRQSGGVFRATFGPRIPASRPGTSG